MTLVEGAPTDPLSLFQGVVARELFSLVCDEQIGWGIDRQVYVCGLDENLVVKIEPDSTKRFQNVAEWQVWQTASFEAEGGRDAMSRWLAPCRAISACGCVLIQERTRPARIEDMPDKAPVWLSDYKLPNWGWLGDRIVCHDYGLPIASFPSRLRKAEWRTR